MSLLNSLRFRNLIRRRRPNHRAPRTNRRAGLRHEMLESRQMLNGDYGDLSLFNDEFDDPTTLEQWQLVSDVEGWGNQPFETMDIHQTNPGALTIEPHTSTWYQDYQGDLAFKEVSGDFIVTTHVTISDRDDLGGSDADDIPNDSTFSLAGLMVRTPTGITDAANQWTPGNANFVFLSLGHGYDGGMSLESKSTQDSVSNLQLIPINNTEAELRVERSGGTITTMYRMDGQADWTLAETLDRSDMPETLQVGMVSYSDYGKTSTFTPLYANSNTLTDTPENANNSSNPYQAYNPDIAASFDYIRFERPDVIAPPPSETDPVETTANLNVVNAGFEDITGETPVNEFTFGPLPGWDLYDPNGITDGGDGPVYFIGTLQPTELPSEPGVIQNFPGGAAEGERVAIAFNFDGSGDGGEYGLEQTLVDTLQPNTTYSLAVDVGNIATGTAVSGQTFYLDGLPGYRVELLAGGQVIAMDDNSLAGDIAEGEFGEATIEFITGNAHPQMGQALGIRLINLNETSGVPAGNDLEVDFDNVRLTATTFAFQQIGDQQMHHADTLMIPLDSTTADGTPVSYSVVTMDSELWTLDQQYDLQASGYAADGSFEYHEDYAGYGVKWMQANTPQGWMFLESDGSLHQWQDSIETSPEVAVLSDEVFADPSLLHEAIQGGAAEIDGDMLVLEPTDGYIGTWDVAITKVAGELTETEFITVEATNIGPQIPIIESQIIAPGETLAVPLPAVDADGDVIQYDVEVIENTAADLRMDEAIYAEAWLVDADYAFNYLGENERWVRGGGGWLFITEAGSVHQWNGNYETSPQVAQLDARYHADPSRLVNAVHVDVEILFQDGQLQLTLPNGDLGDFGIRLSATDGIETAEQWFLLTVM